MLLIAWEPLNFAGVVLQVLPSLVHRGGIAAVELIARGAVAMLCVAAGFALLNGSPDALRLARIAIVVSVARVIQSIYWSVLPNDTIPGDEPFRVAVAILVGALLVLVMRPSQPEGGQTP